MAWNPSLVLVSALFFLALVSAFYVGAYVLARALLRLGQSRLSHAAHKRVLMTALVLPPLLALVPTLGGATLRHSHLSPAVEHHSMACEEMFTSLFSGPSPLGTDARRNASPGFGRQRAFLAARVCRRVPLLSPRPGHAPARAGARTVPFLSLGQTCRVTRPRPKGAARS